MSDLTKEKNRLKAALWRKNNPEKSRSSWVKHRAKHKEEINARCRARYTTDGRWEKQLWNRFKITPEQYWQMFEKQCGLCKICKNPQQPFVGEKLDADHDHATGKIRGLLCRHCNTALGSFRDSKQTLLMAVLYLMEYENK